MSLEINDIGELEKLLKKLDLKVKDLDELKSLLATVQKPKDPEQARLETIKKIGVTVPCTVAGIACAASFFLCFYGAAAGVGELVLVLGLAAIWGAVAAVSVPAVIASTILLRSRPATSAAAATAPAPHFAERPSEFVIDRKEP